MGENLVCNGGDVLDLNRGITGPGYKRLILGAFVAALRSDCICPNSEAFLIRDYGGSKGPPRLAARCPGFSQDPLKSCGNC